MAERPYGDMTDEELDSELDIASEERRKSGIAPQVLGDIARRSDRTTAISLRVPASMLERLRVEAERLGVGYQTLLIRLVEVGLSDRSGATPARIRVPAEVVQHGHLVLDVELVPGPAPAEIVPG